MDVKEDNEKDHVDVNDDIDDDGDDCNDDNANEKDNDNDVDGECHQLFSYTWCQRWFIGILYIYILYYVLCFFERDITVYK